MCDRDSPNVSSPRAATLCDVTSVQRHVAPLQYERREEDSLVLPRIHRIHIAQAAAAQSSLIWRLRNITGSTRRHSSAVFKPLQLIFAISRASAVRAATASDLSSSSTRRFVMSYQALKTTLQQTVRLAQVGRGKCRNTRGNFKYIDTFVLTFCLERKQVNR